ncbi:hypothetical protein CC1G_15606 [Coprinopsis cinerea okayama7|uniref:F-box domain-containing protein n=1 Tax=Coprinopsis cinerea (strain Okayama-7 / 130 / ATCC MYA-4618 / FGSC 9003) TaxID=240176 RepID=D6RND6_COPC7|nr:hypothetical protein CC1G_15606 [Coprinopsis cinerea okayama7\|eukprot:XP_002911064.1 hypothetical protein CC1G_15606 [Coprinopsis cinerea okayama7\
MVVKLHAIHLESPKSASPESFWRESRPTLHSLLVVSKNFCEATADYLWRELDGLTPLLRLIPQLIYTDGLYFMDKALSTDDLRRWSFYSRRVKSIRLLGKEPQGLSQVFTMLSAYDVLNPGTLFPALREIHCRNKLSSEDLACYSLVASPSIEVLTFVDDGYNLPAAPVTSCLQQAAIRSPRLQNLVVRASQNSKLTLFQFPWETISQFPHLQSLTLELTFHNRHLDQLYKFDTLKEYSLSLFRQKANTKRFSVSVSGTPSVNRNIRLFGDGESTSVLRWLTGNDISSVTGMTLVISPPHAETMAGPQWDKVVDCLAVVGSNLKALRIERPRNNTPAITFPIQLLGKVMALDGLTHLRIVIDCQHNGISQPDDLFHHLLLSAKHKRSPLTHLALFHSSGLGMGTPLSFHALDHVAKDGGSLVVLEISIDSSRGYDSFPSSPSYERRVGGTDPSPHRLRSLRIRDIRESDFQPGEYRRVALFLDHTFPSTEIRAEGTSSIYGGQVTKGWKHILELMEDYRQFRRYISDLDCGVENGKGSSNTAAKSVEA